MTVCTYDDTLFYLILQLLKSNLSPKTPDTKQLILFLSVVEIEYPRILNATSTATFALLILGKPLVVTLNKGIFRVSITITALTSPVDLGLRSQRNTKC